MVLRMRGDAFIRRFDKGGRKKCHRLHRSPQAPDRQLDGLLRHNTLAPMNWRGRRFPKLCRGCPWSVALVLVAIVLLSVATPPPEPPRHPLSPESMLVADGNSTFSLELLPKLKSGDGNLIISPFSISSAMAMAYGGARGDTEKQIAQTLHFPTNQPGLHSGMATLLTCFTNVASGDVELIIGNALWPQSHYQFTTDFLGLCRKYYRAELEFADFRTGAEVARRRINSWAERTTKGKINGLFPPGAVNADTRLVIANAIYFKGKWASRFDKSKTQARPFWIAPDKPVQVPMMSQKAEFLHLIDGDTQVLEMPYRGRELSMLLLLPKARDGLPALEAKLTLGNLTNWIEHLHPADIDLLLPRFKIASRSSLSPTLSRMGMPDAFDEARADFTGMTAQRPLFISRVEHAALVEVDEEGTVAAAATGMSFGCAQRPPPATFHADHPFVFLILDQPTRTVLFIGEVSNPAA
jgi:serpin B